MFPPVQCRAPRILFRKHVVLFLVLGLVLILRSANGNDWGQDRLASWPNFTTCSLIRWFIFSTWLLDFGLYGVCNSQSIPKSLLTCWMILAIKCQPLSDEITAGTPNLGIISCNSTLVTSLVLLVRQGNASGHPEKVSVKTSRYRNPPFLGSSEKSICHCCPG